MGFLQSCAALLIALIEAWWEKCPWLRRQLSPWVPWQSTRIPQWLHTCGWQRTMPKCNLEATLVTLSSILKPREDIIVIYICRIFWGFETKLWYSISGHCWQYHVYHTVHYTDISTPSLLAIVNYSATSWCECSINHYKLVWACLLSTTALFASLKK